KQDAAVTKRSGAGTRGSAKPFSGVSGGSQPPVPTPLGIAPVGRFSPAGVFLSVIPVKPPIPEGALKGWASWPQRILLGSRRSCLLQHPKPHASIARKFCERRALRLAAWGYGLRPHPLAR